MEIAFSGNITLYLVNLNKWKLSSCLQQLVLIFCEEKPEHFTLKKRTHLTKGKFTIIVYFMVYRILFRLRILYIIQLCRIIEIRKNKKYIRAKRLPADENKTYHYIKALKLCFSTISSQCKSPWKPTYPLNIKQILKLGGTICTSFLP